MLVPVLQLFARLLAQLVFLQLLLAVLLLQTGLLVLAPLLDLLGLLAYDRRGCTHTIEQGTGEERKHGLIIIGTSASLVRMYELIFLGRLEDRAVGVCGGVL